MSTTFGVRVNGEYIPIARRHGTGHGKVEFNIINPLVLLLPKGTLLENDNSSQGIETVGDLHAALSGQMFKREIPPIDMNDDEFPEPHM